MQKFLMKSCILMRQITPRLKLKKIFEAGTMGIFEKQKVNKSMAIEIFEEKFPSLKDKSVGMVVIRMEYPEDGRRRIELASNSEWLANHTIEEVRAYRNDYVNVECIKENCIDKQKVKEVLDKWKNNNLMEYEEIYKELGL